MLAASAIADPVRRQILELLHRRPRTAGQLASEFAISRPAVSRHLRVLREAGLATAQTRGRERVYVLDVAPLAELDVWLGRFRDGWAGRLDALDTEVRRTRRERRRTATDERPDEETA